MNLIAFPTVAFPLGYALWKRVNRSEGLALTKPVGAPRLSWTNKFARYGRVVSPFHPCLSGRS